MAVKLAVTVLLVVDCGDGDGDVDGSVAQSSIGNGSSDCGRSSADGGEADSIGGVPGLDCGGLDAVSVEGCGIGTASIWWWWW